MNLGKDISKIGLLVLIAVCGCRFQSIESMRTASAPNQPFPEKGDPYTFGGLADGTGGSVVGTTQSMESETYADPKFKQLAGTEPFVSMSGHTIAKAKPSEVSGDYQPLPHEEVAGKHGESGEGEH